MGSIAEQIAARLADQGAAIAVGRTAEAGHDHVVGDVTDLTIALNAKAGIADIGNTIAPLIGGVVPIANIPAIPLGATFEVPDLLAMLGLSASVGDFAVLAGVATYRLKTLPATDLANWVELPVTPGVTSIQGLSGAVTLPLASEQISGLMSPADKTSIATALTKATDAETAIANVDLSTVQSDISSLTTGQQNLQTQIDTKLSDIDVSSQISAAVSSLSFPTTAEVEAIVNQRLPSYREVSNAGAAADPAASQDIIYDIATEQGSIPFSSPHTQNKILVSVSSTALGVAETIVNRTTETFYTYNSVNYSWATLYFNTAMIAPSSLFVQHGYRFTSHYPHQLRIFGGLFNPLSPEPSPNDILLFEGPVSFDTSTPYSWGSEIVLNPVRPFIDIFNKITIQLSGTESSGTGFLMLSDVRIFGSYL